MAGKGDLPVTDRVAALPPVDRVGEAVLEAPAVLEGGAVWVGVAVRGQAFYPDGMNRLPVGYNGCT